MVNLLRPTLVSLLRPGVVSLNRPKVVNLTGASTIHQNWPETGLSLMHKLWQIVAQHQLQHNGINVWVYEGNDTMFCGVALSEPPAAACGLECKAIELQRYILYKHVGPYEKIRERCMAAQDIFRQRGLQTRYPYLEVYGHWTDDASKLETELIWCLQ